MHQRSGKTLRALERDISISDSTLSRYFRGQATPTWPTAEKICTALGGDPTPLRGLWRAAMAEKSHSELAPSAVTAHAPPRTPGSEPPPRQLQPPSPSPGRTSVRGLLARLRESLVPERSARLLWLAAGLALGLLAGYPLGAAVTVRSPAPSAPDARSTVPGSAAPATAGMPDTGSSSLPATAAAPRTNCPWKYVVTDGIPDDVLVFDNPRRDSIVARYAPRQVFYAPEPPRIQNGMMRTQLGWVGVGNWIQRYRSASCRTGSG
jgi:hypothetical protein